jgi:hypothetical protein
MNRTRVYVVAGVLLACFGSLIALGALLTSIGIQTGIDGDSVLTGAGIAVAGAGAAFHFLTRSSEPVADRDPAHR